MPKLKKRKYQKKTKTKKNQPLDVDPISCKLLGIKEFSWSSKEDAPVKYGRYHGSCFSEVEHWGVKQWVVGTYILVDYESLREEGKSDDEIVQGCLKFLNPPPVRKKFQKKAKKPIYGSLEQVPVSYSFVDRNQQKCISVLVVTDSRKNKKFWGEGIKL